MRTSSRRLGGLAVVAALLCAPLGWVAASTDAPPEEQTDDASEAQREDPREPEPVECMNVRIAEWSEGLAVSASADAAIAVVLSTSAPNEGLTLALVIFPEVCTTLGGMERVGEDYTGGPQSYPNAFPWPLIP